MRHEHHIDGHGFRLRPVHDADAGLIVDLRGDTTLNRFLHATSGRLEDQLDWLARYYDRAGDFYFVIESVADSRPVGVISLYDIDKGASQGEWGRWILRPGTLAAVESAWLIYRFAFETLGLRSVYCRTVAENESVVSFHDSCGIEDRRVLSGYFELGGRRLDAVEHRVDRESWVALEPRLARLAKLTARRLALG